MGIAIAFHSTAWQAAAIMHLLLLLFFKKRVVLGEYFFYNLLLCAEEGDFLPFVDAGVKRHSNALQGLKI